MGLLKNDKVYTYLHLIITSSVKTTGPFRIFKNNHE